MKNIFKIIGITAVILFSTFSFVGAQGNPFSIEFPISELGNCNSTEECKVYCDDPANIDGCIAWAEVQGIITPPPPPNDEASKLLENGGPGGCNSPQSCDAFCSNPENHDTCFQFAKDNGLIPPKELQRIEERMENLERREIKTGPGGCNSFEECDTFCRNPDNNAICLQFAVDEGNITHEEADYLLERTRTRDDFGGPGSREPRGLRGPGGPAGPDHRGPEGPEIDEEKAMELISTIGGPGGCSTFSECDAFCSTPKNDEVCMDYAIEHELVSAEEIQKMERLENIVGPGGCRGIECKIYCEDEEHSEECIAFAIENDLLDPREVEEIQKFMDIAKRGGPGGCSGRAECDEYCSQPGRAEECFQFAKENDLIPEHEMEAMEREMEIIRKLESRNGGPGGCIGEECHDYCNNADNIDECMAFAVDAGMMPVDTAMDMMEGFVDIDKFGSPPEGRRFRPPSGDFRPPEGFEGEYPDNEKYGSPPSFGGEHNNRFNEEYDRQFEEEFEKRFEVFEQRRGEFEAGERGDFSRPPFSDDRELSDRDEFPKQDYREYPGSGEFPSEGGTVPGEIPEEYRDFIPREGRGFVPPDGFRDGGIKPCPAMPTVDICPSGQRKEVMFDSPECGTYYGCVPERPISSGEVEPFNHQEGFVESQPAGEFNRQFEGEFNGESEVDFGTRTEEFMPPEGFNAPQDFIPPEEFTPPESVSLDDSVKPQKSLLGSVLDAFLGLFN